MMINIQSNFQHIYPTAEEAEHLQQELTQLQLEVNRKRHYSLRVKHLCNGWTDALQKQEERIAELNQILQGAFHGIEINRQI